MKRKISSRFLFSKQIFRLPLNRNIKKLA